jgi:cytochrome c-type biogenesis protein CcmH
VTGRGMVPAMRTLLASALVAGTLAFISVAPAQDLSHGQPSTEYAEELQGFVPGAERLEGRLLAPCCWNQTLDIHSSEVSNGLRREIRTRLRGGETPDVIETDIIRRYGTKILAVPPQSPLKTLAIALSGAMGLAGAGAAFMLVRWRRRSLQVSKSDAKKAAASAASTKRDELDDRLDQELDAER